ISTYAISNCGLLEKIIIPNSVTLIDAHEFLECDNEVIYCEGSAKGINWSENWNYDNNFVIWNYADE
ncbi:MAG: hypothetical protein IJW10_00495, partial [Clostridia bacterium]|nr:hypothetical protein [Clostridia bacterium]